MTSIEYINAILVHEDIEGLISVGAPQDEYSFEALKIAESLGTQRLSEEAVTNVILHIWANSFGLKDEDLEKRLPEIRLVAREIVNGARDLSENA